jgi:RimJ/RimL family protein N-acetyltransferase
MTSPFVPYDFRVPDGIPCPGGTLRLLNMDYLAQDFDAYMSSIERIQKAFDYEVETWPYPGLSMRLALADTAYCEWEHFLRTSFSYCVFTENDARHLGCIYIHQTGHPDAQAHVMTWTRADGIPDNFDDDLFAFAKDCVARDWPFEKVVYPGHEHPWADCRIPPLVPAGFDVPESVPFEDMKLTLLNMDHTRLDYAAYMANIDHLKGVLGPDIDWPREDLTPRLALADTGWCEWMHDLNICFSFALFDADMTEEIGCLYLSPSKHPDHDVEVCFWLVKKASDAGMDERFLAFVKDWLATSWPFRNPGYPGREVAWEDWPTG